MGFIKFLIRKMQITKIPPQNKLTQISALVGSMVDKTPNNVYILND